MDCPHKHTKYQPTDEEWKCPKCGATAVDGFIIEDGPNEDECPSLHNDDFIRCSRCDYETSGKAFAAYVMKKNSLVPCPCCKGKGMVNKDSPAVDLAKNFEKEWSHFCSKINFGASALDARAIVFMNNMPGLIERTFKGGRNAEQTEKAS